MIHPSIFAEVYATFMWDIFDKALSVLSISYYCMQPSP